MTRRGEWQRLKEHKMADAGASTEPETKREEIGRRDWCRIAEEDGGSRVGLTWMRQRGSSADHGAPTGGVARTRGETRQHIATLAGGAERRKSDKTGLAGLSTGTPVY
ncbi:hypothetical protein NDU88_003866 [Pleurodeles waltl]|uniref:Uncharacterized protein n=1 Tax=Pleurodeles waltl TaxID=8319 RepID=A0AAV7V077_PLEWA|nr:hypothetical protein NDU88_003866 [Pleurodeles waltl]